MAKKATLDPMVRDLLTEANAEADLLITDSHMTQYVSPDALPIVRSVIARGFIAGRSAGIKFATDFRND